MIIKLGLYIDFVSSHKAKSLDELIQLKPSREIGRPTKVVRTQILVNADALAMPNINCSERPWRRITLGTSARDIDLTTAHYTAVLVAVRPFLQLIFGDA